MKRILFFWIDKLQIKRSERIVLSVMMMITLILSSIFLWVDFSPSVNDYDYAELEKVFHERSAAQQAEHDAVMARYEPLSGDPSQISEVKANKEPDVKNYEISEPEHERSDTTRVNINKADVNELQELPGIGPAYASRIIEWRQENGEFKTVEQLLEIRGIGPKRLENIRPLVVL